MSKRLFVERKPSTETETEGFMYFGRHVLATMEKPWVPHPDGHKGGKNNESCIPEGLYQIHWHERSSGAVVPALTNQDLGVWYTEHERPAGIGRYLILIHAGNWSHDVIGCIAPGMSKNAPGDGPMVRHSGDAMKLIKDYLGDDEDLSIDIRWIA